MALIGAKYTLATIATDLGTRLDDSTHVRWTLAEKCWAIKTAIRMAKGMWWEERLDDTNKYDADDFRYTLPPACVKVISVHFDETDLPRYFVVPSKWHLEGNELVFTYSFNKYDGETMYIRYLVYPHNLLTVTAADGVIATTGLGSVTSTFVTSEVAEGDEVEVIGDTGGPFYVSSITSNVALVLHKAPTAGAGKTFHIARYTDLPYEYLIFGAMGELHEFAARNRPGVEVEELIKWATYYRQMARQVLSDQARHRTTVRGY